MKTVFLHGLGQTAQDWKEVVQQLSISDVDCPELFSFLLFPIESHEMSIEILLYFLLRFLHNFLYSHLKGRDFVHQGKIEIDVNERAVFIRTQGCFFVYTNSDCFLNSLRM